VHPAGTCWLLSVQHEQEDALQVPVYFVLATLIVPSLFLTQPLGMTLYVTTFLLSAVQATICGLEVDLKGSWVNGKGFCLNAAHLEGGAVVGGAVVGGRVVAGGNSQAQSSFCI
jgi:hypothetical protein